MSISIFKYRFIQCFMLAGLSTMGFISCDKDQNSIDPELIPGAWRLEQVSFNQIDGSDINPSVSNSSVLYLGDDHSYNRNYVSGEWTIDKDILLLDSEEYLAIPNWEYQVLEVTSEKLVLQISLTEGEYFWDFDEFEEDEILNIKETYIK